MVPVELLQRVPLFDGLDSPTLERIAAASREETFRTGNKILDIGDPGREVYLILDGTVQVLYPARSRKIELARLGRGEFFGEMSLLNEQPRSATVRAADEVKVLVLEKSEFRRVVREEAAVAYRFLEALSNRIRDANEQISGLSEVAIRDPLTELLNRRAFEDRFREEVDRSRRYGDTFSLILLDIDRFKRVNDEFGHDVGDVVLEWVGNLLKAHTRSADAIFRIGGEEFAILAPATQSKTTHMVARRLISLVSDARPPVDFDLKVTLSGGFASCPAHGTRTETLFNLADQALFRAKNEGRNRICAPEEHSPLERTASGG